MRRRHRLRPSIVRRALRRSFGHGLRRALGCASQRRPSAPCPWARFALGMDDAVPRLEPARRRGPRRNREESGINKRGRIRPFCPPTWAAAVTHRRRRRGLPPSPTGGAPAGADRRLSPPPLRRCGPTPMGATGCFHQLMKTSLPIGVALAGSGASAAAPGRPSSARKLRKLRKLRSKAVAEAGASAAIDTAAATLEAESSPQQKRCELSPPLARFFRLGRFFGVSH
jgi:hypothetical protein